MRKKVNLLRHIGVLFLTIIIFTVGILIGGDVEQLRVQSLYTQLQEQDLEFQNLLTQERYIDYLVDLKQSGNENISCDLIKGSYQTSIIALDDSRIKLENYINTGSVKEEEFQRLKEHYANVQINYWILANKIKSSCDSNLNPILYFYADKETCPSCEDQGVHLSYVKQKLKDDVLIFVLDSGKLGTIQLLAQKYEVSSKELPVLVIDEKTYGFLSNEKIFEVLCENGLQNNVCKQ